MTDRDANSSGFTLVELMVVVLIIGMIAGVASLAFGESGAARLEMAQIQVRTMIERAQALARSNRVAHGVVFDTAGDRIALVDEAGALVIDPLTRKAELLGFTAPNQPKLIDVQAAAFGATGAAIVFDPQGVPLTGGTITLAHGTITRQIAVDAATGRVSTP